jgi:uncharacterized OsmC-like protein
MRSGIPEAAMEVVAQYLNNVAFDVSSRGHHVMCDQPLAQGGGDAGMTPPEFLLAALASCAGYYAASYLDSRGLPVHGLAVRVTAEKDAAPARLSSFRVVIKPPESVPLKHQAGILRAASHCLIHNTLLNRSRIDVSLDEFTERIADPNKIGASMAMDALEARP